MSICDKLDDQCLSSLKCMIHYLSVHCLRFTGVFSFKEVLCVMWPSENISNRVCGIWLSIGEGANIIIGN